MYLETCIIYKDGKRVEFDFTPSNELYLKLNDYCKGTYGCESFYTGKLSQKDMNEINRTDSYLKPYLKTGCILDFIIHRSIIING